MAALLIWPRTGLATVTLISNLSHSPRVAYVCLDNRAADRTAQMQQGDLSGIYNGGGGAEGIRRALKEADADRKIVFIGHGLTPDTRALLIDGTMDALITQNPQGAVMNCVRIFANVRDGRESTNGMETTRSQVIFRENLP